MENQDVFSVIKANETNKLIFNGLGKEKQLDTLEMLSVLPSNAFKELNAGGEFTFDDLPVPLVEDKSTFVDDGVTYSEEIKKEIASLLSMINDPATALEYPYLFYGTGKDASKIEQFKTGGTQTCSYDWDKITEVVRSLNDGDNICLFHTHPKPFGSKHKTLASTYPDELKEFGVKQDGLNLSVSDLYLIEHLEKIAKENGKELNISGMVLMHTGEVVSYKVEDGYKQQYIKRIDQSRYKSAENQV